MAQTGQPSSPGSPSSQSQGPANVTVVGTRRVLISLASVAVVAAVVYWLFLRSVQQEKQVEIGLNETRQLGQELNKFRSTTTQTLEVLPKSQEEVRERLTAVEKVLNDASEALNLLRQQSSEREASNAVTQERTTKLHHRGNTLRQELSELRTELGQWKNHPDNLMASDDGKRIAAAPELLLEFIAVEEDPCPSQSDIKSLQERLEDILVPVDRAHSKKDGSLVAAETLETTLDELEEHIQQAGRQFREQRRKVNDILDRSPELQASGGPTLQQALDAQLKAWDVERTQAVMERLELARKENDQIVADARAAAERLKAEELARVEKHMAVVEVRHIAEAAEDYAAKERERLQKRAADIARQELERAYSRDLQQIRTYLQPFLGDGYRQPGMDGRYTTSTTKGPVSLTALRGAQALDPGINGLATLTIAAERSDRTHSGWPRLKVSGQRLVQTGLGNRSVGPDQEFVQRAQDLLIKYGELMVKKRFACAVGYPWQWRNPSAGQSRTDGRSHCQST